MSGRARAYFISCGALIGWVLGYALPIYAHLARPFYDPVARHWMWSAGAGPIPMGYYGQMVWAFTIALIVAGLAAVATRFLREPSDHAYLLWGAWTITSVLVVMGYFAWNNWP